MEDIKVKIESDIADRKYTFQVESNVNIKLEDKLNNSIKVEIEECDLDKLHLRQDVKEEHSDESSSSTFLEWGLDIDKHDLPEDDSSQWQKLPRGAVDVIKVERKTGCVEGSPCQCLPCDLESVEKQSCKPQNIQSKGTKQKAFQCESCDYKYERKQNLLRHITSKHIKVMPHQCPSCDYSNVLKKNLQQHVIACHGGKRHHPCPSCDFKSVTKYNLLRHIRSKHSGERPYQCTLCSYSAVVKGDLKSHFKFKHGEERPHHCPSCDYKSVQKGDLLMHIKFKHTAEKPYGCSSCNYKSVKKGHLQRHIISKHTGLRQ